MHIHLTLATLQNQTEKHQPLHLEGENNHQRLMITISLRELPCSHKYLAAYHLLTVSKHHLQKINWKRQDSILRPIHPEYIHSEIVVILSQESKEAAC